MREKIIEFDFSWIEIQGRSVKGNTLTAHKVDRVVNAPKVDDENPTENSSEEMVESLKSESKPKQAKPDKPLESIKEKVSGQIPKIMESDDSKKKKDQVTFDFEEN